MKRSSNHFLGRLLVLGLLFSLALFFTACPTEPGDEILGTELSTDIDAPRTLAAGNYTVTGNFYVNSVLTISPGATIRFMSGTWIEVTAAGQILANGTADNHITFRSSAAAPAAGAWSEIQVDGNGASFTYCDFSHATAALDLNAANATVSNCTFSNNTTGINAWDVGAGFTLTNNAFTSNGEPLYINMTNDLGATNTFTTNTNQRIFFNGAELVAGATRNWAETEVPMYVDSSFYVNGTLILAAGTTLSFGSGVWLDVTTTGILTANGTTGSHITFTSSVAAPAAGSWSEIEVNGNGSSFQYCDFRYATTALDLNGATTMVNNCAFTSNTNGVDAWDATANVTVTNNAFTSNGDPLTINDKVDVDTTNTFTSNTLQRIYYNGGNIAAGQTRTWSETEVPFYISTSFYISGTLILNPGATLSMASGVWINVNSGGILNASSGTVGSPITFTSALPSPVAGSWDGIYFDAGGSSFTYCNFLYAAAALNGQANAVARTNVTYTTCTAGWTP